MQRAFQTLVGCGKSNPYSETGLSSLSEVVMNDAAQDVSTTDGDVRLSHTTTTIRGDWYFKEQAQVNLFKHKFADRQTYALNLNLC